MLRVAVILAILITIVAGCLLNLPILLILESHEKLASETLRVWSLIAIGTTNLSISQILLSISQKPWGINLFWVSNDFIFSNINL